MRAEQSKLMNFRGLTVREKPEAPEDGQDRIERVDTAKVS